jgi:hypothetical protein
MSRRRKILIGSLIIFIVATSIFLVWAETPLGPMPEAIVALQSNDKVLVSTDKWLVFQPKTSLKFVGFIFYPGGRVNPRSYAPAAHAIAEKGYLTVIVPMPLNLAVFGAEIASDVIAAYPEIKVWAIGGHSLGGTMAAQYARKYPSKIGGLALWASYPSSSDDLSDQNIQVVSIYGTRDGLVTSKNIADSHILLPSSTTWMPIEGGNHAQMGWYGPQPGDNDATISREVQQIQVVNATLLMLENIEIDSVLSLN